MRAAAAWIITLIWAACYVRKLIEPDFPVPAEITPVMLLGAGYLFSRDVRDKLREKIRDIVDDEE